MIYLEEIKKEKKECINLLKSFGAVDTCQHLKEITKNNSNEKSIDDALDVIMNNNFILYTTKSKRSYVTFQFRSEYRKEIYIYANMKHMNNIPHLCTFNELKNTLKLLGITKPIQ